MCGIFGVIGKTEKYANADFVGILEKIARFSEVRGKDSSGLAFRCDSNKTINILRSPVSIKDLLKSNSYIKNSLATKEIENRLFSAIGHARLVTNGTQLNHNNNQPVVKDGIIGVHNGIIVNDENLWKKHPDIIRKYQIDTEIIFSLFRKYFDATGDIKKSIEETNNQLKGTVSIGFFVNENSQFVLFTNNGSLYILTNYTDLVIYASEKFMLQKLIKSYSNIFNKKFDLKQVEVNNGYVVDCEKFKISELDSFKWKNDSSNCPYDIVVENLDGHKKQLNAVLDSNFLIAQNKDSLLEYNISEINKLKRCSKCLLPETFPFIYYDNSEVCNYCHNYIKRNQAKPIENLLELVDPYRKTNNQADCLVPFSGGRDSTYVLHYVKNILNLNPIAYTYDWGMVTDLARRNIARVCGQLGVENIIVAADISKKRKNINKNISAWLKKPSLGMIPLFMAGDKYFFKFANQIKKQNNIDLQIWGINFLENTDFKVGFAGVPPEWDKDMIYSMNAGRQLKLFKYVIGNIISNPRYINSSIFDTFGSYVSRYLNPRRDYYHFFDYHEWNESKIEDIILDDYDWEVASDLNSTWRIGDGTASFYNYIYYTVSGFSEFDTFRSNQIREGMISRSDALIKINEENKPRFESLAWYLEILGLDFVSTIRRINNIPKMYR